MFLKCLLIIDNLQNIILKNCFSSIDQLITLFQYKILYANTLKSIHIKLFRKRYKQCRFDTIIY